MKEHIGSLWGDMPILTKAIVVVSVVLAALGLLMALAGLVTGANTLSMSGLVLVVIGSLAAGGSFMNFDAKRKRRSHQLAQQQQQARMQQQQQQNRQQGGGPR